LIEIRDQKIIIDQVIIIKMLNNLNESFAIYLIILNESTRRDKNFFSLNVLFKNLKDEKTRMRFDFIVVANLAIREKNKKKKTRNKSSDFKSDEKKKKRSKNDYTCNRCERSDYYFNDCFHKNFECNSCHRIDHFQRMCRFEEEKKEEENNRNVFLMIEISDSTCELTSVILINDQITKKILDFETINHIFCNKKLFSFITLKFNSFETNIEDKFKIDEVNRIILILIDEKEKKCIIILNDVLYSSQL
jgi:hypothetical protein